MLNSVKPFVGVPGVNTIYIHFIVGCRACFIELSVTQSSPIMSNIFIAKIQDILLLLSLKYLFTLDLTDPLKWVARARECARGLTGLS